MNIIDFYKNQNKQIKLNLGCRRRPFPGYINVDIDPHNIHADIIDDAFKLNQFADASVDLIEHQHMAEHLDYKEFKTALQIWYNKLKPDGILRMSVPDMEKCSALLLLSRDRDIVKAMFNGSQLDEWDYHLSSHTENSLTNDLKRAGFECIKRWNPEEVWPHNFIDSFASATWPPMHKKYILDNGKKIDFNGIYLSLNLEATKSNLENY